MSDPKTDEVVLDDELLLLEDEFEEPIDQFYAAQVYRESDIGIPIRHPLTRESYTLYGPHALDVLRRRKKQGFVVVGTDPLESQETLHSDDSSASSDNLEKLQLPQTPVNVDFSTVVPRSTGFPPAATENVTPKTPKKMGEPEDNTVTVKVEDNER